MKKKARAKKVPSFFELSPEEREREVAKFDEPIDIERDTRPLTRAERAEFDRWVADKPHVSLYVSNGQRDYIIHLDDELLKQAAKFAKKNKTSLPKMIDRGLRGLLAFQG